MDDTRASKRMRVAAAADWSDLPTETGGMILSRVPSLADRACFRSVCRQWRLAAQQHWRLLPPALPWLATTDLGTFISLPDGACHSFSLLTAHAGRSWEVFDEWLVMFHDGDGDGDGDGDEAHLLLTKPLSEDATMKLPYASKESLRKLVMCPGGFVAARIGLAVAFCRPGARSWSKQPCPPEAEEAGLYLMDIALHRGTLYGLYGRDTLCAYDVLSSNSEEPKVTARVLPCPTQWSDLYQRPSGAPTSPQLVLVYLVSSSDGKKLLMVRRFHQEIWFKVLEADLDARRWTEVATLDDDQVLFVSSRCSRALQAPPCGGGGVNILGNRVVYTDENERYFRRRANRRTTTHGGKYEDDDIGHFGVHDIMATNSCDKYKYRIVPRFSFRNCQPSGSWLFFAP